jgi:hypothetical protein
MRQVGEAAHAREQGDDAHAEHEPPVGLAVGATGEGAGDDEVIPGFSQNNPAYFPKTATLQRNVGNEVDGELRRLLGWARERNDRRSWSALDRWRLGLLRVLVQTADEVEVVLQDRTDFDGLASGRGQNHKAERDLVRRERRQGRRCHLGEELCIEPGAFCPLSRPKALRPGVCARGSRTRGGALKPAGC